MPGMNPIDFFVKSMITWYRQNGRDLPWRHHPNAYQVWVSELMLQQTQVSTVLSYYSRWMERFPDIESLAEASLDEVLGLWAGLGYYRRAGYLHEGAKYIVNQFGGRFPESVEALKKITGIGNYTAGAIASFAFGQNVPAIDGNAERVLSRYFAIQGDLTRGEARKTLEQNARRIADLGQSTIINQAIMDLGSHICGRNPQCENCPLVSQCLAFQKGFTESIPQKKIRPEKSIEFHASLRLVDEQGRHLIVQRSPDILLGNLWEYPTLLIYKSKGKIAETEGQTRSRLPRIKAWKKWFKDHGFKTDLNMMRTTGHEIRHTFTHIQMHIMLDQATCLSINHPSFIPDELYARYEWVKPEAFSEFPMSNMMKKVARF